MEASFNVFQTNTENDGPSDPEQEDYYELNDNFTHLTKLIRIQYFTYLKKIIEQNYAEWKKNRTEDDSPRAIPENYLEKCAAYFEERAVRYCMVVQLYRKYMLRIISEIRRETTCCELIPKLKQCQFKNEAKINNIPMETIKHEQPDTPQGFLKTAYKRKLENNQTYCIKLNRMKSPECVTPSTTTKVDCKENLLQNEINAEIFHLSQNGTQSNDSVYIEECNGSPKIFTRHLPIRNHALVPYTSEEESSQQSTYCDTYSSPKVLENNQRSSQSSNVPYESLSLQEKIIKFEQTLQSQQTVNVVEPIKLPPVPRKRRPLLQTHLIHKKLSISQPLSPVSTSSEEDIKSNFSQDSIAKDLENLFAEGDQTCRDIEDIFGDGTYNPQIEHILREIETSKVPGCGEVATKSRKSESMPVSKPPSAGSERKKKGKRYKLQPLECDLRQSLWPCELHMWKQRLRETLEQLAEADIRHHDQIRYRFEQLFGDDSEDEFAPYSPSLEMDEILIASCMKRIAPLIVKYLMQPLKEGLVANRYLFKKLAKKFAFNIVMVDQYADEEFIKEQIDSLFCTGRKVESLLDIENI